MTTSCTKALTFVSAALVVGLFFAVVSASIGGSRASAYTVAGVAYGGSAGQSAASESADLKTAQACLAVLQDTYRYLDGVTISEGSTPQGAQAVAYYTRGEIVINPNHEARVEDIVFHEVWHIIDWRDNGTVDWREDVPPSNIADYLK